MLRKILAVVLLLFISMLGFTACDEDPVVTLAKTTRSVATAADELQKESEVWYANGDLTEDEGIWINELVIKVIDANESANDMVVPLSNVSDLANKKDAILELIDPIIDVVDNAIEVNLIEIKNAGTRAKVRKALVYIKEGMRVAKAILGIRSTAFNDRTVILLPVAA